jgi:hypothetical protein
VTAGPERLAPVVVPFEGEGRGIGELAWGQRDMWSTMRRQKSWLPMGGSKPLEPGTTLQDVADELAFLMRRYPSMRTRLCFAPDGAVTQEVHASGEIALDVVEAGDQDPYEAATAVANGYHHAAHDFAEDWPIRMAVVLKRGVPVYMAVILCHLVTDGVGAATMLAEAAARPRPEGLGTGTQALAQVEWQRSPAGRKQNDAALRHVEAALRSVPARPDTRSTDRQEPRHWMGRLDSPALFVATPVAAERVGADTSSVLLAAYAVALGELAGPGPVVVRPTVSNRFRPGFAEVVGTVAQHGLCVLDVAGVPFAEAVRQARRAAMTASKYAYCDPFAVDELIVRLAEETGYAVDTACFFNDRRNAARPLSAAALSALSEGGAEGLPAAAFQWTARQDDPFEPLMVHVDDAPDTMRLAVFVDTARWAPKEAEEIVRRMEEIVVAGAAHGPGSGAGTEGEPGA